MKFEKLLIIFSTIFILLINLEFVLGGTILPGSDQILLTIPGSAQDQELIKNIHDREFISKYCFNKGFSCGSDNKIKLDLKGAVKSLESGQISRNDLVLLVKRYSDSIDFTKLEDKEFADLIFNGRDYVRDEYLLIDKLRNEFEKRVVKNPDFLNKKLSNLKGWFGYYHYSIEKGIELSSLSLTPEGKHSVILKFCVTKDHLTYVTEEVKCERIGGAIILEDLYQLSGSPIFSNQDIELKTDGINTPHFSIMPNVDSNKEMIKKICVGADCFFDIDAFSMIFTKRYIDQKASSFQPKMVFSGFLVGEKKECILYKDFCIKPLDHTVTLVSTPNLNKVLSDHHQIFKDKKLLHTISKFSTEFGNCNDLSGGSICLEGEGLDKVSINGNGVLNGNFVTYTKLKNLNVESSKDSTFNVQSNLGKKVGILKIDKGKVSYYGDFFQNIESTNLRDDSFNNILSYSSGDLKCSKCSKTKISDLGSNIILNAAQISSKEFEILRKIKKEQTCVKSNCDLTPRKYLGYCNDAREINLCKMLFDAAHKRNLDPNALMTLLFAEGLAAPDSYSIKNYYLGDINSKDHKIIFDPFGETGADSLNENMIRRLQSLGYLRKDLKIGNGITKFRSTLNEKRESVKYAQFDNLQDLIESSTALYKYYDRLFERDFKEAKEKGIIPTNRELDPRERIAWSFLYYNCGPGTGKNELFGRRYSSPTIQKNQIFQGFGLDLTKKYQHISGKREGSKIVIRSNVCRKHALERTATWEIMDEFRILNPPIFGSKTVAKK